MSRSFQLALLGSAAAVASAFLPWLRLGDVGLRGVADPAGVFVAVVGAAGVGMSVLGLRGRDRLAPWLVLVGLAVLTTLTVVWLNGPATIADRALARAEAIALVDRVPLQPVPPVRIGAGLVLGVLGALLVSAVGIRAAWHSPAE
jgi:hypothetical protein